MLSRGTVATMAALSTAACRVAAFVPTFTSNAVVLGTGRARHTIGAAAPIINRRNNVLHRHRGSSGNGSSKCSSSSQSSLTPTAGRGATVEGRRGGVRMMMMSSERGTAEAETLTARIKFMGDEIRRSESRRSTERGEIVDSTTILYVCRCMIDACIVRNVQL